jgi:polyisoprenoid-binding protein YceI
MASPTLKLKQTLVLVLGFVLVGSPAALAKLARDGGKASVSFTAKGPAGMNIIGTTSDLQVKDDGKNVIVNVALKDLTTGIAMRDKHLREKYLEVGKYPDAVLTVERGALKVPAGSEVSGEAKGVMKLHGKSKTASFSYKAKKSGSSYIVTGSVHVNIVDYGITIPSFLGVTVKPDVDVSVSFSARDS